MIYLKLTKDRWCAIDVADYEILNRHKWTWHPASTSEKPGYAVRWERVAGRRKKIYMHRQLVKCPPGLVVDHRDRNGLNNQRHNLYRVTYQINNLNRSHTPKTSGYRGVSKSKSGRWRARCYFDKKVFELGTYVSPENAARAYDEKAFELFCEFAELNFPQEYEDRIPSEAIPF